MKYFTQFTCIYKLFRKGYRWQSPIIEINGIGHSCLFNRINHWLGFRNSTRQRFFAQNHFSGFCRCYGNFSMHIVGGTNIYGINVSTSYKLSPVGFNGLITPLIGKGLGTFQVTPTNCL